MLPIYAIAQLFIRFGRTLRTLYRNPDTRGLLYLVALILFTGTLFYHFVEGWRWLDSLYFSVITLTTVGYGDFAPQTDAGKLFTIVYIFIGLGILAGFITAVAQNQPPAPSRRLGRRRDAAARDESVDAE